MYTVHIKKRMLLSSRVLQMSAKSNCLQKFNQRQICNAVLPASLSTTHEPAVTLHQYTCPVYPVSYIHTRSLMTKIRELIGQPKLKYSKKHLRAIGTTMYVHYSRSIDSIQMMKELELPDTFLSWYKVVVLHVWMIMLRLTREGPEGRMARNGLVAAMWRDIDIKNKTLLEHGSTRKRADYKHLQQHFYGSLLSYDEGILSHDRVLAGAVWRDFFELKEVDAEKIDIMVEYIRKQIKHLDEQEGHLMLASGRITLLPFQQS